MNKNELITFLRNPNDLTDSDLSELEKIVANNPYFLNGRLLLAKASKELKHPDTRQRIISAAVYSTDRPLFKKYLSDKLFFLSKAPEKEEIVPEEIKSKPKEVAKADLQENKSQKIEIIDSPKSLEKEEKPKEEVQSKEDKPRREPRFDPTATASFKRRWDVQSESEAAPKSKSSEKPAESTIFAGKKIDRSNRVKKRSIREELLDDSLPKKKISKPAEPKPIQEVQKPVENRTPATQPVPKEDRIPVVKSTPPEESKKEAVKSTPDVKKEVSTSATHEKIKSSEPNERPKSFFDDAKKVTPQKKKEDLIAKPKPAEKPEPPKKAEQEEHIPVVIRTTSKPGLNVPEVPSGGIDAILEELQRDMENLKSSRIHFTEVQQKIEEDDAVSAAVERATKKIPESKPEPAVEVAQKEEELSKEEQKEIEPPKEEQKGESKEEKKTVEPVTINEEVTAKKVPPSETKKEEVKEKPKAKKVPSAKKKTPPKKESSSKKATPKKTGTVKASPKAKSTKTKSTKKEEKKDDDKSGKQKVDQSSIIDKFIAETPSIKYQKKSDPVQNSDLSGESSEWNKELASEYLAEIYLHQGNKKRAIEIYKALSLKFPNKKSYFADLISKTK